MKAFLTGSYVYGRPKAKSDIDLVVFADEHTNSLLQKFSDTERTIRFGKLNIILCVDENEYNAWKITTERLTKVHRETGAIYDKVAAHDEFEKDRRILGVEYHGSSGPA